MLLYQIDKIFNKSKCTPSECISTIINRSDSRFYQSKTNKDIERSKIPPCVKDKVRR